LDVCLGAWPRSASTLLLAAQAARRDGALDEAEELLNECKQLEEEPSDGAILEYALLSAQSGGFAQVEKPLRVGNKWAPQGLEVILEVVTWELMRQNRLREARLYLDQWLKRRPGDVEALVRRGWVGERLFDKHSAVTDYREALALS